MMEKVSPRSVGKSLPVQPYWTRFVLVAAAFIGLTAAVLFIAGYSPGMNFNDSAIEVDGKSIFVKKGGDLQSALDRAQPGDTITLEAGAVFKGAFTLPAKDGTEFITIQSSAPSSKLPTAGERVDPQRHAAWMPKLEAGVRNSPVLLAKDGAHHFRFIAVAFGPTVGGAGNIIQIGTGEEDAIEDLPHHIEFDRVYIHGSPTEGQRRGIAANGRNIKIENSYISDIKRKGDESQAVAVWAADGPVEIVNNYLEAAAENILFGGAGSILKLVPTDCVVRNNYLNKPLEWRDAGWLVKNLFEVKNGRRITVENNLMTHNWGMGQDGMAILFTVRADNGRDSVIEDIEFTGNLVRGSGGGLSIFGEEGGGGRRLVIRNNVFEDLNGQKWNSAGHFMKITDWDGLTIENNTILQTGNITNAYGKPVRNFIFRNNIVFENEYGIKGDNMGKGQEVIDKLFSNGLVEHNVIIGGEKRYYRDANFFPLSLRQIGFVDPDAGDYRLRPNSPFINRGVDGKQIGANVDPKSVGFIR